MAFRIRQIDRTADGREIVRERLVDNDLLTLGRAAENDLHLPDLALDPHHATLALTESGRIAVAGALGFTLDGTKRQSAQVDCRAGAELGFGSYRLTVSTGADGVCTLTVRQAGAAESAIDNRRGFSLAGLFPGKRRTAWAAALAIFVLFLAIPIATHLAHRADPRIPVMGDASWRPGKLSLAHHGLERSCESCHVQGFVAVNDRTCTSCHKDSHDHATPTRLSLTRAEPGLGGRFLNAVAQGFGKPGPGACVDCHVEHEGPEPMARPAQTLCSDCHGTLRDRLADTRLGDASDFGRVHPQFRPRLVIDAATGRFARVSLDARPRENNGLTFPHRLHLDPLGGAARMAVSLGKARGYGGRLECGHCHHPTEDAVRFRPIEMERDCESCHSLAYDRVGGTVRRLRHGDVDQAIADISVAPPPGPLVTGRGRPGAFARGGPYYSSFSAPPVGGGLAGLAFSRAGICGECHTPVSRGGRFGVMPVTLPTRFLDHGWFNHRPHRQTACATCHAARESTRSSDLLLPPIATCRTCHQGEEATKAKVPSGCAMCHSYHPPTFIARRDRQADTRAPAQGT